MRNRLRDSDAQACIKIKEGATENPLTKSKEWKGGYESRDIFAEKYKVMRFYLVYESSRIFEKVQDDS
ncbi:hypothetical protein KTT_18690 [Tengunoibacter tsumagoiensis]|uniref:Uncharacterized protein n=1 Tax=Tengunoibacter tsumagoiensis TaxID=2014871 RepID=A0A401ZYU4_9CHLR|nr:hypothetical protein KTT_18690 [Tengunoibacter tsumagoiensis]